jgi:branched-chain amino acid transport system substrate-binding protein
MRRLASIVLVALSVTPATSGPAQEPIRVGAFLSMTGPEATFGVAAKQGIELAFAEHDKAGGVGGTPLALTVLDTAGKPAEARFAARKLIDDHQVVALLGELSSSATLQAATVAQAATIPLLTPSATNTKVTETGDMISRACFDDEFQGAAIAKLAYKTLKKKRVALLSDSSMPYSRTLAEAFRAEYKKLGGKLVADESYAIGDPDYKPQLDTIRDAKPDAIVIPGYYTEVAVIAKQARAAKLTVPLVGGDGWESPELLKLAGADIDNSYFVGHFAVDDPRPIVKTFVASYEKVYGQKPDALAALGYDAANLLVAAMKRSKSLQGADLAAAIASTKNFAGVTGTITFDKRRTVKSAVAMKIAKGKVAYSSTIAP